MDEEELSEQEQLPPIKSEDDFDTRLRALATLDREVEEKKTGLKELEARKEALSYSLAQYMLSAHCKSKVLDNVLFTQKQKIFSKVEDKEALRTWIQENDAIDLLMAVHPSKLTSYCNEQLELGGTTPAGVNPNFIKYFVHVKGS